MKTIEIARRLAELGQIAEAQEGYATALKKETLSPEEELEAAMYLFASKAEDHRPYYRAFVSLFNRGLYQGELLELLSQAFYFPNLEDQQKRYEANCKRLAQYTYLFRRDFPAFEDLPLLFFPFDDQGYLPYDPGENRFGEYVDFNDPVIDRYFFQDLDHPILAKDVYSQYQLEYLNDTVRKSEWVGRENHIYLHYTNWHVFCAHLQCLQWKELLKEEKFVFLIEDEVGEYPIDFQARFGVDYAKYPLRPVGIREVNRLIWHTQLATHNGGDFFNEIFAEHPNLIILDSVMFEDVTAYLQKGKEDWQDIVCCGTEVGNELLKIKNPTLKDFFVAFYMVHAQERGWMDRSARIAPALFFQPHFPNMNFGMTGSDEAQGYLLSSKQYEMVRTSPLFLEFKYVKAFSPIRRITTSHAASVRFAVRYKDPKDKEKPCYVGDLLTSRILNRSFMRDPEDRLYRDSIMVRFEDGKLNPTATFTALAEFLDIPYTESMKTCTTLVPGYHRAFSTDAVYATYDEYAGDTEREILEFFMQDAYKTYGYDFQYYKGEDVDAAWLEEKLREPLLLDGFIENTSARAYRKALDMSPEEVEKLSDEEVLEMAKKRVRGLQQNRLKVLTALLKVFRLVNPKGELLEMIPLLKPNPSLLEQPLYH